MKNRLKSQVFKYFIIFSTIIMVLLWLLQTIFLEDIYKFIRTRQLDQAITYVSENIDKKQNLTDLFKNIKEEFDVTVELADTYKRPQYDNKGIYIDKPKAIERTETFTVNSNDVKLTFFAMITPLESTVSILRIELIILTGIILMLSIVVATIISKVIATPIEKLNEKAKILASGNLDVTFEEDGYLEIRELSNTLNMATKEISQTDQYRKDLIANVSHDLRTPLAHIYSYAELMKDFPEEINQENLSVILNEAKSLNVLVSDLLEISQMQSASINLNKSEFDLIQEIDDILNRIRTLDAAKQFDINVNSSESIFINADKLKIGQVIYNLVTNAINHSGTNTRIDIDVVKNSDMVRVNVIDYGKGISPEHIHKIWDRYYKSGRKIDRSTFGSGLGLSIVKEIIELHDGKYGVESIEGKQTLFYFELKY